MCEKDTSLSRKKSSRSLIRTKVDLYEVCVLLFQIFYYYYYFYTNNVFPSARFVAYLTLGERSLGSIGQEALSRSDKRRKMIGGR